VFTPRQAVLVKPIDPESDLAKAWAKAYSESYQGAHAGIDEPLIIYECNGPGRFPGECSILVFPDATFEVVEGRALKVRLGAATFRAFVPEAVLQPDPRNLGPF
jgi:hypothetical protein